MQLYPFQLQLMNNIKQTMKCIEIENVITMRVYPATASGSRNPTTSKRAFHRWLHQKLLRKSADWLILNSMNDNLKQNSLCQL